MTQDAPLPPSTSAFLGTLVARLTQLEAERDVRHTYTRYMALCDVPVRALSGESLAALFTPNAVWEGIGKHYESKFGRLEGRDAIAAMLSRYLPPTPHFTSNTHFVTSETIEVAPQARRATGRWIMLQASGYVDGRAELIGARLEVDFVPAGAELGDTRAPGDVEPDGSAPAPTAEPRWLIAHFRTERLFDAPWQVNPRAALPGAHEAIST